MSRIDEAVKLFDDGFNCSQAVLAVYGPQLGLERETALEIAAGFGGGIGCMGDTCGALTGAFMVIGLKYGAIDPADKESKLKTYALIRQAAEMFAKRTGALNCRDLLGFDMSTPQGKEQAAKEGAFEICADLVKYAAEILEEILSED